MDEKQKFQAEKPTTENAKASKRTKGESLKGFKVARRSFLASSALAAGALSLSGCKKATNDSGEMGGTMNISISEPVSIDPYNLQESEGTQVGSQIFDSLTVYDFENQELDPAAAVSWEANSEATVVTFHLQPDARFHNGEPVTAKSFKRGWERLVNPNTNPDSPSVTGYHLAMVDGYADLEKGLGTELTGVTCPDDLTLVVKLSEPYADFPIVVSHPALAPVPEAALEDFATFFQAPIGNGPFKMKEGTKWESGQYIELVKNEDFYGEVPALDGVYFNIQKDIETAYREFQAGNLDIVHVPTAQLEAARQEYGTSEDGYTMTTGQEVLDGVQSSTYYLVVNNDDPVLKDRDLRIAISLAINRQNICDTVFKGTRVAADNIVPPGIIGYEEGAWRDSRYDPEEAENILNRKYPIDSTFSDGSPKRGSIGQIKLSSNIDGGHKEVMEVIMNDLKDVGIDVVLDQGEWASILNKYQTSDYQIGRLGWVSDYPIMDNFMYPLFYTGTGDNQSTYSNKEVDTLIERARKILDEDQRIAAFQQVNRIISEDMPVIPILFYKLDYVGSQRVEDVYIDPQMLIHLEQAMLTF